MTLPKTLGALALAFLSAVAHAEVRLPAIFSPHGVLQAGRPVPVFGRADPGERVTVAFGDARAETVTDPSGRWEVSLPAMAASATPRTLVVEGTNRIEIPDLLVGEVWFCSGQSNMEWPLIATDRGAEFIAAANDPLIRVFKVPHVVAAAPQADGPGQWTVCTPQAAGNFTAVGYHLARRLRAELGVPVGILDINWGGTRIEPWIPRDAARDDGLLAARIDEFEAKVAAVAARSPEEREAERAKREAEWRERVATWLDRGLADDPGVRGRWMDPGDDAGWRPVELPAEWSTIDPTLAQVDGTVWFRRTIAIPAAWAGRELELHLGAIDDADRTYFAGSPVGATGVDWTSRRRYAVPAGLVREGSALVAVACVDTAGAGGLVGPAGDMWVAPRGAPDAERLRLDGGWSWRRGGGIPAGQAPAKPEADPTQPSASQPAAIWNAMGAWVAPYAIRGAAWYQGESNAGEAERYRALLARLVDAWRDAFRDPELPFGVVQLAAFMPARPDEPAQGGWAEIRESQRIVAEGMPKVGLVVTLDVGDADDIHPRDKDTVGGRLARWALVEAYGRDGVAEGPDFRGADRQGRELVLTFTRAAGLATRDGGPPRGFAIAGPDGVFRWADARIDGERVILSHPDIAEPAAARYAWQNNPTTANLVNGAGLPASSFRFD